MDTDTSVPDTEKMLVMCNTFHGHALSFVDTNMVQLQQSPFVWLCLLFQHLIGEYLIVGLEIHVLLLDHVTEVQLFSLTFQIKLLFSPRMALDRQPSMYFSLVATPCTVTSLQLQPAIITRSNS